jgi:hypothetical protein
MEAYVACMASHGVTLTADGQVPEPSTTTTTTVPGATTTTLAVKVNVRGAGLPAGIDAKTYRAARQACKDDLPSAGTIAPTSKVGQCLSDQGIDPTKSSLNATERAARQACKASSSTVAGGVPSGG